MNPRHTYVITITAIFTNILAAVVQLLLLLRLPVPLGAKRIITTTAEEESLIGIELHASRDASRGHVLNHGVLGVLKILNGSAERHVGSVPSSGLDRL